jgi:hypothetical protein
VDGTASGSYSMACRAVSAEPSGSSTREFVRASESYVMRKEI